MSGEKQSIQDSTDDARKEEVDKAVSSKNGHKTSNNCDAPNYDQGNNSEYNDISVCDCTDPPIFKKYINFDSLSPFYASKLNNETSQSPANKNRIHDYKNALTVTANDAARFSDVTMKDFLYSCSPEKTKAAIPENFESPSPCSPSEEIGFNKICSKPTSFRARIDIGTGFNMRTISTETDSLIQFTTLTSEAPTQKATRMADTPFNLTQKIALSIKSQANGSPQKADDSQRHLMTEPFMTPQLSYGTHGWTRIPHDNKAQILSRFNESPTEKKERDKKKITPTPIRRLKSIRTYKESPPPITVSKDRRPYGMFSPRSVYKRQLLSRRDLFVDGYESPPSPWGSGRWHDTDEYCLHDHEIAYSDRSDHSLAWDTSDRLERGVILLKRVPSPQSRSTVFSKNSAISWQRREKYSPASSVTSSSPSSERASLEELDWSGLFSPENDGSPAKQLQTSFGPSTGVFVIKSEKMRHYQPSKEFIPSTL